MRGETDKAAGHSTEIGVEQVEFTFWKRTKPCNVPTSVKGVKHIMLEHITIILDKSHANAFAVAALVYGQISTNTTLSRLILPAISMTTRSLCIPRR